MDYILAEKLSMPLYQIRQLPNAEIEEWRAYIVVEQQKQELEELKAKYFK